jgi:ADP-L-glycero-D-manno-heptose 6-epimerase
MILVTGAYGFIGSKFVKHLNGLGIYNIDVSDYLTNGKQFVNLKSTKFHSFVHPESIDVRMYEKIFHFGAISDTTCWDGELVMKRNYEYTKNLVDACIKHSIFLSYSSSASVYGNGEGPLNLYAYSKHLIDEYVKERNCSWIQGFRYFNVYSLDDAEWHKGNQASPYYKFKQQALTTGRIELFEGSENFYRDFVDVNSVCHTQYQMSDRISSGIFDLGSGCSTSFLQVAKKIASEYDAKITEIPFPEHLKGYYQTNTLADMSYF